MRKLKSLKYFDSTVIRRYQQVAAFAVLGVLTGVVLAQLVGLGNSSDIKDAVDETTEPEAISVVGEYNASLPIRMRIPAIELETEFEEPLGVDNSRAIEVPKTYTDVAYYKYGPTPGELGPAVVLGHVDSYMGPAVFYNLRKLEEGDLIEIDREDGTTATFAVERLATHSQTGFPTAQVYGDLEYPGLRLITCTGTYDQGNQRYSHNLIVFAKLVE